MNAERRIQRVRRALQPVGSSQPDWKIICDLAREMGHVDGFEFMNPEEIWNEIRDACEGARGMTYQRLDHAGLQWPCPEESHPGTPILHVDAFASGVRAPLRIVEYRPTPEQATPKYPFVLTTGRSLYEFNAGTMTGRSRTRELRPSDLLEIAPTDAEAAGVRNGDFMRVVSRYGSATIPVRVSPAIRAGELFATFHTARTFLNNVTSSHRDGRVGTPEFKVTAVRIERI
jgi:formate dehydrogenase major subunit